MILLEKIGVWILRALGADLLQWAIATAKAWIAKRKADQERIKAAKEHAAEAHGANDAESSDSAIDDQLS